MAILAVDIGGSGSRAIFRDRAAHTAVGAPLEVSGGRLSVAEALETLAVQLPYAEGPMDAVAVGMASLAALGDADEIAAHVHRHWPFRRLVLTSDAVTALWAAWGPAGGAVVAAGTGVVGFATDYTDQWVRVDGWGNLLGDAGGGAWIGAHGLQAALRAADKRAGGSEPLLRAAIERYGHPSALPAAISRAENPARALAQFVPAVSAAAADGDAVADGILAAAAHELAVTAEAAVARSLPKRVALVGGLTAIGALTSRFETAVKGLVPGALLAPAGAEPVQGALGLAEAAVSGGLPAEHPPYLYLYDAA